MEADRLAAMPPPARVALGRVVAACLALGFAALAGVRAALPRRGGAPANLAILDDAMDDAMTVQCVSNDQVQFVGVLQEIAGYAGYATPSAGVLLTDRGAYAALFRGDAYDPEAVARTVVDAYDDAMEACLNDASSCYPSFAADAPTCSLDVGSDMPWPQISCTEDCVQDLFFAMDNGAYATCEDPVAAAMFLTPNLFKSCLVEGSTCYSCVDGCLAADADSPLVVGCEAASSSKAKKKTPQQDTATA